MKPLPIYLLFVGLTACGITKPVVDDPVRHLLEARYDRGIPTNSKPAVAIARPFLPPYLERVELVTRTGDGRLEIHEMNLWAEPLDAAIARVVADNLRRITNSTSVQPSTNFIARDYRTLVEIRIERFDPDPDGMLVLECTWKAQPVGGGDVSPQAFLVKVPIIPLRDPLAKPLGDRIVAMNHAMILLSQTIAKAL